MGNVNIFPRIVVPAEESMAEAAENSKKQTAISCGLFFNFFW